MAEVTTYKSNPVEKQKFLNYQIKRNTLEKSIKKLNLNLFVIKLKLGYLRVRK